MVIFRATQISKFMISTLVALALATGSLAPNRARADTEAVVGALLLIGAACAISGKCTGKNKRKNNANQGRNNGPSDAVALNKSQRRLIQEGLASGGFYGGAIDGSFGKGTRQSIREYQASVGAKVTGVLSGSETNTLAAMSPSYASLPPDSPLLFETDLARDTEREQLRAIQARLNGYGYNAGPEDGSMGGKTRTAIASYKLDKGLPGGAIPTVRLLSHLNGVAYAGAGAIGAEGEEDRRIASLDEAAGGDQGRAEFDEETLSRVEETPVEAEPAGADDVATLDFNILDIHPGMSRGSIETAAAEALGADIHIVTGVADQFGGVGALTLGHLVTQSNWPAPGSQQLATFFDADAPGEGAVAIFRTIMMPGDATEEDFQAETVPALIEAYGMDGLIDGTLTWVGDGTQRGLARTDPALLAKCGALTLQDLPNLTGGPEVSWETGAAPGLDAAAITAVTADCGDVLTVQFADQAIQFGLWNATRLAAKPVGGDDTVVGGADEEPAAKLPKIKF